MITSKIEEIYDEQICSIFNAQRSVAGMKTAVLVGGGGGDNPPPHIRNPTPELISHWICRGRQDERWKKVSKKKNLIGFDIFRCQQQGAEM